MSEGRNPEVIQQIADAVTNAGCHLLDVHSDPDHNRSVYTMVGNCEQISHGAIALAQRAIALIDLRRHEGVHPRIGAVDVIPFVPLVPTPMSICVDVARNVGASLGTRLGLPVFLYGRAATSSQRASLPWIRRGGLAALARKLADSLPDFGPARPHPTAGAVAVGARDVLVAFNVVLDTSDVSIARAISTTLREANGGLPGVKALGLVLASRQLTQVSMNLTDIAATDILTAFRAVEREANRHGIDVLESEIVGLVPGMALAGASAAQLRMREDPQERLLELRIADLTL